MKSARAVGDKFKVKGEPAAIFEALAEFDTEELCIKHLEQVRWPDGLICIREDCGSRRIMSFNTTGKTGKPRHLYECVDCRYQYSVTTGTIFHNSHVPLRKWFMAIHLICAARKNVSVRDLERALQINYRTAGYIIERLRRAIQQEPD